VPRPLARARRVILTAVAAAMEATLQRIWGRQAWAFRPLGPSGAPPGFADPGRSGRPHEVDGRVLPSLPSKRRTLTIMANAVSAGRRPGAAFSLADFPKGTEPPTSVQVRIFRSTGTQRRVQGPQPYVFLRIFRRKGDQTLTGPAVAHIWSRTLARARSSVVEHLTFNQRVAGSIPAGLTIRQQGRAAGP
jgi:hypothetical protein